MRAPVENGELEYVVDGPADGDAVLFIHDGLVVDTFFAVAAEPALKSYRRIRYARRGYAGSTDPDGPFLGADQSNDAAALIDHLGVERAHVVAYGAGARAWPCGWPVRGSRARSGSRGGVPQATSYDHALTAAAAPRSCGAIADFIAASPYQCDAFSHTSEDT